MINPLANTFVAGMQRSGQSLLFFFRVLGSIRPLDGTQWRETIRQVYFLGVRSLVIIMTCAFFVGMVLALQGYNTLNKFGATDAVGTVLALSLLRELGPVLTALLYAGRAGTSVAAEIGLMKATEQITALDLMAVDPVERVVVPRFLGAIIVVPCLTVLFNTIALVGGLIFASFVMGVDNGIFWMNIEGTVSFAGDFLSGTFKSIIFGIIAAIVPVFTGYYAVPTGEGVGQATTRAVVTSSVLVLLVDFIITSIFF